MNILKTRYIMVIAFNILLAGGLWFVMRGSYESFRTALYNTESERVSKEESIFKPSVDEVMSSPPTSVAESSSQKNEQSDTSQLNQDVTSVSVVQDTPSVAGVNASNVTQSVPFLVQAPFGAWSDPIFQHACEEASMIMAMSWAKGETFSDQEGKRLIQEITKLETRKFGRFVFDTSLEDTMRIMKEYFQYDAIDMKQDIDLQDIKNALDGGAIVIVPVNGRLLRNPYFTAPGPAEHMLVIYDYDAQVKEFITNDPGTRNGAGYRYDEDILYGAIRDYMTGNHVPVKTVAKPMIMVRKEK